MSDALVQINDRLAQAARARALPAATFYCECGNCLAEDVSLSLEEHDEIRAREDMIFAAGHDAPGRYPLPPRVSFARTLGDSDWVSREPVEWRLELMQGLIRTSPRA
jgi:hypothetical protein